MEATLKALGDLLIQSVPTIAFFLFLIWYLKRVYFRPVAAVLEERRRSTEGVRELAQRAFEAADKKQGEFEHALQLARGDMYQEHEKLRRQWSDEQAKAMADARSQVDVEITEAKKQIAQEAERAQSDLDQQIEGLSAGIVNTVLARRAA